jgi:hypothetical protein
MDEIPLTGGNLTQVVRMGDTVRRAPGPWTPAVHMLLRYLESTGFDGAPRALGFDEAGREVLGYIEGVAGFYSADRIVPPDLWSDGVLIAAAQLLRRYHDAASGFVPPNDAIWQLVHPDPSRHDVICHNDFAWYNCIFRDGLPCAVIDFDIAGPGPRAWDVAYAAWRFVPLVPGWASLASLGRRLKLFCDAYGLDDRSEVVDMIQERMMATRRLLLDGAAAGHAAYQALLAEGGHVEGIERDLAFVEDHAVELQAWVDHPSTQIG